MRSTALSQASLSVKYYHVSLEQEEGIGTRMTAHIVVVKWLVLCYVFKVPDLILNLTASYPEVLYVSAVYSSKFLNSTLK
jgi:hypothetical protein